MNEAASTSESVQSLVPWKRANKTCCRNMSILQAHVIEKFSCIYACRLHLMMQCGWVLEYFQDSNSKVLSGFNSHYKFLLFRAEIVDLTAWLEITKRYLPHAGWHCSPKQYWPFQLPVPSDEVLEAIWPWPRGHFMKSLALNIKSLALSLSWTSSPWQLAVA